MRTVTHEQGHARELATESYLGLQGIVGLGKACIIPL